MELVLQALRRIRTPIISEEFEIHRLIKLELDKDSISFVHEYRLAPRNRIDFLTIAAGIGIEVKKGKPNEVQVYKQLERYLQFEPVNGIILVIERYMDLPDEINGKPVRSIALRKLYGVAH